MRLPWPEPPSCPGVLQPYPTSLPYPHPPRPKNPGQPHSHKATFLLQLQNGEADHVAGLYLSLSLKKTFHQIPLTTTGLFWRQVRTTATSTCQHPYPSKINSKKSLRATIDSCADLTLNNLRRCRWNCRLWGWFLPRVVQGTIKHGGSIHRASQRRKLKPLDIASLESWLPVIVTFSH